MPDSSVTFTATSATKSRCHSCGSCLGNSAYAIDSSVASLSMMSHWNSRNGWATLTSEVHVTNKPSSAKGTATSKRTSSEQTTAAPATACSAASLDENHSSDG